MHRQIIRKIISQGNRKACAFAEDNDPHQVAGPAPRSSATLCCLCSKTTAREDHRLESRSSKNLARLGRRLVQSRPTRSEMSSSHLAGSSRPRISISASEKVADCRYLSRTCWVATLHTYIASPKVPATPYTATIYGSKPYDSLPWPGNVQLLIGPWVGAMAPLSHGRGRADGNSPRPAWCQHSTKHQ